MRAFITLICTICTLLLLLSHRSVGAAETRTCKGKYELVATSVNGVPPQKKQTWTMGDFRGKGEHKSGNKARVNAKKALKSCYNIHWDMRWEREKPRACDSTRYPGPDGGKGWVEQYGISDIKTAIEKTVCCSDYGAANKNIEVAVYGTSQGDNGCFSSPKPSSFVKNDKKRFLVAPEYKMACNELRPKRCQ